MFDWIRLFGFPSNQLKDSFLLYKRVTEQYNNPEILKKVRSLIPTDIVLKIISTKKDEEQYNNVVPLLKWFKKEFMKWTPTEPVCEQCISNKSDRLSSSSSLRSTTATVATIPRMQLKEIREGNSWKMRSVEIFVCRSCNYEFAFPRYGEILNIVETKTGRCSEWSILFGAMLSSLGIKTRIVHDFLNHCWNEVMFSSSSSFSSSSEKGRWVHIDSTLDYPISLNHSKYYEQNWNKEYQYVLAFTADEVEDVTKTYTTKWETILKRRLKSKNNSIDFSKLYTTI
ncbi:MAG: transglutaminase domain-containing protein [Candidatus Nitrosocosmicus sp.]